MKIEKILFEDTENKSEEDFIKYFKDFLKQDFFSYPDDLEQLNRWLGYDCSEEDLKKFKITISIEEVE